MRESVLAKRYARALFDLAKEEGGVELYREGLFQFQQVLSIQPDLLKLLCNRDINLKKKKNIIEWISEKFQYPPHLTHFFFLLLDRGRMFLLPSIFKVFEDQVNILNDTVIARVCAADTAATQKILDELKIVFGKITQKKVECVLKSDPSLIGGFQVRIGDTVYDGSIRAQLDQLKETLMG